MLALKSKTKPNLCFLEFKHAPIPMTHQPVPLFHSPTQCGPSLALMTLRPWVFLLLLLLLGGVSAGVCRLL